MTRTTAFALRRAAGLLPLLLASGCGGGGVGSPTSTPTSLVVVDGITGSVLADVASAARPGDPVTIERGGHLRRDTIAPRNGIIALWPVTVDEAYVRTLVYSEPAVGNRLMRWPSTTIPVPRDFPPEVTEAVRPWVALVPSDTPEVTITIDPADPSWAQLPPDTIGFALRQVSDADAHIVSTRLVFRSEAALREPGSLLHEVGHALGLQHSARRQDLMFPSTARTSAVFSADERVLLTMMYAHRRPGQVAPDNDQALGQAGSGIVRILIN